MKLKPCPLCGGEAITESRFVSYEGVVTIRHDVICNGCGCKIENFQSKEQAINRWNRRESIDKIVEQLKACRDKCAFDTEVHAYQTAVRIVKGGAV